MQSPLSIDQHALSQLIHLLTLGQSSDNQQQAQVYHMLSSIEEKSISYIYLAYILAGEGFNVEIRKLAGVTLSSFLKRNKNVVHFSQVELHQLKQFLMNVKTASLETVRSVAISELITRTDFDYELFYSLCSSQANIGMVNIILEDIKYNSQNYNFLQHPQFRSIMASIYSSAIPTLQALVQNAATADPLFESLLKCINLLTFHCPPSLDNWLMSFVETIVKPVLMGLINHKQKAILLCLQGLNEIIATKSSLVKRQTLEIIINLDFIRLGASVELSKLWSNIMIEIVDNDDEGIYRAYLNVILPKVIEGLRFTHEDQRNMRQQMQVQYNPYNEQTSQAAQDEDNDPLQSSSGLAGYTLRKLSFQLINKISITYSEGLWEEWAEYIFQRIATPDPLISQTAVSFIGIIAQTCMYDMKIQLQHLLVGLLGLARSGSIPILQATSLWALQKLYPAIKQLQSNQSIIQNCLNLICSQIDMSQYNGNIQLMVKEAAISFLDQLLSGDQISSAVARNITVIVHTLVLGLRIFTGRALFNIFKTISSIFENQSFNNTLTQAVCDNLVGQICKKWSISTKNDSVMCPLIQCLITGFEGKRNYLLKFSIDFAKQLIPMLEKSQRKQLILRAIDFLSSLISSGQSNLTQIVLSQRFLQSLHGLIVNQQKQIKHFAYILVSDLGKKYDITPYLQIFAQQIGRGMDSDSLTSRNNALMCLTDLIEVYPSARVYLEPVLGKIIEVISTQKLENVYAFNFSRMIGRIALIESLAVKKWLLKEQKLLGFIFTSLRTREVDTMTTNSFKGMLSAVDLLTPQQIFTIAADLQTVLQALVCYPLRRDQNQENATTLSIFIEFTKRLRVKLGQQQWRTILQRPIFLQGAIRTLQSWCN